MLLLWISKYLIISISVSVSEKQNTQKYFPTTYYVKLFNSLVFIYHLIDSKRQLTSRDCIRSFTFLMTLFLHKISIIIRRRGRLLFQYPMPNSCSHDRISRPLEQHEEQTGQFQQSFDDVHSTFPQHSKKTDPLPQNSIVISWWKRGTRQSSRKT